MPAGVFDDLTSLKFLLLGDNSLVSLPVGVFDGLTSLKSLYLYDNDLVSLREGVFEDLLNLEYLDLRGNEFDCIPRNAFGSRTDNFSKIQKYYDGPSIALC